MEMIRIPASRVATERYASEAEADAHIRGLISRNAHLWVRKWFGGVSAIQADREKPWVIQYVAATVIRDGKCAHFLEYGEHAWTNDPGGSAHCVECCVVTAAAQRRDSLSGIDPELDALEEIARDSWVSLDD